MGHSYISLAYSLPRRLLKAPDGDGNMRRVTRDHTVPVERGLAKGCYFSKRPAKDFTKDEALAQAGEEGTKIILKLRYGRFSKEFTDGAQKLLELMREHTFEEPDPSHIPVKQGGSFQPTVKQPQQEKGEKTEPGEGGRGQGVSEGQTEGVEFPAPRANMRRYYRLSGTLDRAETRRTAQNVAIRDSLGIV